MMRKVKEEMIRKVTCPKKVENFSCLFYYCLFHFTFHFIGACVCHNSNRRSKMYLPQITL